jgi:dsDNA-binding SOS-regulon protein
MEEQALESLAFLLAQEKSDVAKILKGGDANAILAQQSADVVEMPASKAS